MINEICLYCYDDDERTSEFKQEFFAIPELYLISIPKFDSKKVIKCNIFLWENDPLPPTSYLTNNRKSQIDQQQGRCVRADESRTGQQTTSSIATNK